MIVYESDPSGYDRWVYGERHNCLDSPRSVYPCRACAQAKVEHDGGDEQADSWPEAHGRWLVGGGRNSPGVMGPREGGDWLDVRAPGKVTLLRSPVWLRTGGVVVRYPLRRVYVARPDHDSGDEQHELAPFDWDL